MPAKWPILLAFVLCGGPASADGTYDACVGSADADMQTMGECGGEWIDREDARLNVAWTRLMEQVDGDTRATILDEQRAWLTYRDASCTFYLDDMEFGQKGRYLSYPACRAEVIASRTQALEDILQAFDPQ